MHEGEEQFCFEKDQGLPVRIQHLLGTEVSEQLLPVEQASESLSLSGYLSHPSFHRPNRTGQYLYINGRPIHSPFISSKVLEGYGTRLSTHRYPLFVLHLHLPPDGVDVNVHPQKKEVRLREEEKLGQFLIASIEKSLEKRKTQSSKEIQVSLPTPDFSFVSESSIPYTVKETKEEIDWILL